MNSWEHEYREAVVEITSPATLDDRILQQARQFKPAKVKGNKRWLSALASSCAAMAVLILLAHPAQYLGALTPGPQLPDEHLHKPAQARSADHWYHLRIQVQTDSFEELCNQWRRQQRDSIAEKMPRDLERKARTHCRPLP